MRGSKVIIDKIVGENIRNERVYRKMRREELAETLELTVSHLGLIERGERGATLVVLSRLAKVFNISTDSLLKEGGRRRTSSTIENSSEDVARKKFESISALLNEHELVYITNAMQMLKVLRD